MNIEEIREFCMALPGATEGVQWDNDLLFRVGGKMFAVAALDAQSKARLSFKCKPETFEALLERDGIIPAPYLARAKWVSLERLDALPEAELKSLLRRSYELVLAKLPKKLRAGIELSPPGRL